MKNKCVYIFGPIHLFGSDYLPIYKSLMSICKKHFKKVLGTYPDFWNSKESAEKFYLRTFRTITKCDLFVAEVSAPSHGVGMELQMAMHYKIPIIALARKGVKISIMVKGLPNLEKIIYYKDVSDLHNKLEKTILEFM